MLKQSILLGLAVLIMLVMVASCAMYHMQTPRTVPEGRVVGGMGLTGIVVEDNPVALPGFWVRTGVAPNADIGVHTWFIGIKMDYKHSFNDYFALGGGGAFAFPGGLLYEGETSVYTGIPSGILYPYAVGRLAVYGFTTGVAEDLSFSESGFMFSAVGGLRLQLGRMLASYGEAGIGVPFGISETADISPRFIFGLGISIGQ